MLGLSQAAPKTSQAAAARLRAAVKRIGRRNVEPSPGHASARNPDRRTRRSPGCIGSCMLGGKSFGPTDATAVCGSPGRREAATPAQRSRTVAEKFLAIVEGHRVEERLQRRGIHFHPALEDFGCRTI